MNELDDNFLIDPEANLPAGADPEADDAVLDDARSLAAKLAKGPTVAFGGSKRLLLAGASSSLGEAMELEALSIATQAVHPEGREGIDAFVNKRRPEFPRP